MPARYTVTIRHGPKVEQERYGELEPALDALVARMEELSKTARRDTVDLRYREFQPIQQVAVRGEISGPQRLRAGLDVRGDGSVEAFTGRLRRRVVEPREGESPFAALRRAVARRTS